MLQEFLSPHGALTLHGVYVWIVIVSIPLSCTLQGMTECEDRDVPGIAFMHARALWEPVNYLQLTVTSTYSSDLQGRADCILLIG